MTGVIATIPRQQFSNALGIPLAGGKLTTYLAGTTTPEATYQDQDLTTKNPTTITLDSAGSCSMWLDPSKSYKLLLKDARGVTQPGWPVDNISGASTPTSLGPVLQAYVKGTDLAARDGGDLVFVTQDGPDAVARSVLDKLREFRTFADRGASAEGDATAAVQSALNMGFGQIGDDVYSISKPLKLPSLSAFAGNRAGAAFTGHTPNVKRAIKKTTNTPAEIKNFQSGAISNIDCLLYMDPAWIDNGVSYPQRTSVERQAFQGNPNNPNFAGIFIEQGSGHALRDLQLSHVIHAIYARDCWSSVFENIQTTGKIVWEVGGTSLTFTNVGTGAGPGSTGGWSLNGVKYSVFNGCWNDGTTDTGWRLVNCKGLVFNGCGVENGTASTARSGTAFAFDGGNDIILNGFCIVPTPGQVIPLHTVGFENLITFNQGTSSFGVSGVNCPDLYIWGDNSTVIYNDHTFLNGTRNNPLIQFAPGVINSRVIVNFGDNTKIFTSTVSGQTIASTKNDGGTFPCTMSFGGAAAEVTGMGTWRKNDGVVVVSGRLTITALGPGAGQAVVGGWPVFAQVGDAALNFSLITGTNGGFLSGVIDKNNPSLAVLNMRSMTGDSTAIPANFSVGATLWYEFSYATD